MPITLLRRSIYLPWSFGLTCSVSVLLYFVVLCVWNSDRGTTGRPVHDPARGDLPGQVEAEAAAPTLLPSLPAIVSVPPRPQVHMTGMGAMRCSAVSRMPKR